MPDNFYTNFALLGDYALISGYENGKKYNKRVRLNPYIFVDSTLENAEYKNIHGKNVKKVSFPSVKEARNFTKDYEYNPNINIYGLPAFHYVYMYENHRENNFNREMIKILNFDIETDNSHGYPNIQAADREINVITMKIFGSNDVYTLAIGEWDNGITEPEIQKLKDKGFKFHFLECVDEKQLLTRFINIWNRLCPDAITGYNIEYFDIPYIIKRLKRNGIDESKLSPFGRITEKKVTQYGKEIDIYSIVGIPNLDYMRVYKKFNQGVEESYSLNYISGKILNSTKLDYSEYGSLINLQTGNITQLEINDEDYKNKSLNYRYKRAISLLKSEQHNFTNILCKDFECNLNTIETLLDTGFTFDKDIAKKCINKFEEECKKLGMSKYISYNVIDVVRVEEIDNKINFFNILFDIAFLANSNFEDCFGTIKTWDTLIHNYLMDRNIVIPYFSNNKKDKVIMGGFVKEPTLGKHKWIMSFDFKSLYPSLCMAFNISPDTFMGVFKEIADNPIDSILDGNLDKYINKLKERNVSIAGNGAVYSKDHLGFIPAIMKMLFELKDSYSKEEEKFAKKVEELKHSNPQSNDLIEYIIKEQFFANKTRATKTVANAGYGAIVNEFFRFFSSTLAESFTASGQLAIKYVERHVNKKLNEYMSTMNVDYTTYCDTDSLYLCLDEVVESKCEDKERIVDFLEDFSDVIQGWIHEGINELYNKVNIYQENLHMSLESIGSAVWIAKKRYMMLLSSFKKIRFDPPKIKMQGIEAVRSTTPKIVRKWIYDAIPLVLGDDDIKVKEYIEGKWDEFIKLDWDEIAMPKGTNDIEKYHDKFTVYKAKTPIHVRGSLLYNNFIKENNHEELDTIKSGDKIKYCYLKLPNPINENVLSTPEEIPNALFEFKEYIDYEKQFDKVFLDAIKRITGSAEIKISDEYDINQFLV